MATTAQDLNRSAGISYQELIRQDDVPPPAALTLENPYHSDTTSVPVSRYADSAFHDLEMQNLWARVWQMACREEEIPEVGDYIVYEIGHFSILVVHTKTGIKAHHNVCRHRGRRLKDFDGHAANFICPFHGFSWNLDGSVRGITSDWDFPHVDPDTFGLNAVQADTWGGWVFINMDMNAGSLSEFVKDLADQFDYWKPQDRYIEAHVGKVMKANWKAVQEAFMEAFHVVTTHPQLLAGIGDENSQYDAWGNLSRAITPNATPSPHINWDPSEQDLLEAVSMRDLDGPDMPKLPDGVRARSAMAAGVRGMMQPLFGEDVVLSDAELSDSIYYTQFPNFHPWGGTNRIVYRFRPWQNRHDRSLMECYYLSPFQGERPPPAPIHILGEDEPWTNATELGMLARVFTQDTFNLPQVQLGLESAQYDEVVLANYQETKLRHFHDLLSKWVE